MPLVGTEQVGRLDVPMDKALVVSARQSECRLADAVARLRHRQGTAFLNQPAQVDALDILHGNVVTFGSHIGVDGPDQVGMIEPGSDLDLAGKAADDNRIAEQVLANNLEGDDAAELPVSGLEHLSHATLAKALQHHVVAQEQFLAAAGKDAVDLVGSAPLALD